MGKIITAIRNIPILQTTSKDDGQAWEWGSGENPTDHYRWELSGDLSFLDLYAKRARLSCVDDSLEIEFIEISDHTVLRYLHALVLPPDGVTRNTFNFQIHTLTPEGMQTGSKVEFKNFHLDFVDIKPRVYTGYLFGWVVKFRQG